MFATNNSHARIEVENIMLIASLSDIFYGRLTGHFSPCLGANASQNNTFQTLMPCVTVIGFFTGLKSILNENFRAYRYSYSHIQPRRMNIRLRLYFSMLR